MTTTELTTIDDKELQAFIDANGISSEDLGGATDFLPMLKINYQEDNPETKKELKKGVFFLTGQEKAIYAKNVTIRPLLQHFQWTEWSKAEKKTVNRTKFVTNFNQEARDEKGTLKCGKPASKILKDNKALQEKYENIKCFRTLHVLVSYDGADEDGNPVSVRNVLATLRLKGVNFNGFKDDYLDNMPKDSNLWDYEVVLGTTKEKNDPSSANSFYVIHYDVDFTKRIPLTTEVFGQAKLAQAKIEEFNAEVEVAYYKAVSNFNSDSDAIDALEGAGASLEDDLSE